MRVLLVLVGDFQSFRTTNNVMTNNSLLYSVALYFSITSCCNHQEVDIKIEELEARRDSLLNIEEISAFQKLRNFETMQNLADTAVEYLAISRKISNADQVSSARLALILKLDKQILELQKQKNAGE